jgi:hypothetical protein
VSWDGQPDTVALTSAVVESFIDLWLAEQSRAAVTWKADSFLVFINIIFWFWIRALDLVAAS